jgi:hypothetical protein
MISELMRCLAAAILLVDHAFAACEGPDEGEATTVVTVPANENVDVFHYRGAPLASVVEFCVREPGTDWILVASHAAYQSKWSLLQSWTYPRTVQIKTTAIIDDDLSPFKTQTRTRTTYGFLFLGLTVTQQGRTIKSSIVLREAWAVLLLAEPISRSSTA